MQTLKIATFLLYFHFYSSACGITWNTEEVPSQCFSEGWRGSLHHWQKLSERHQSHFSWKQFRWEIKRLKHVQTFLLKNVFQGCTSLLLSRWEILEGRSWNWHGAVSPGKKKQGFLLYQYMIIVNSQSQELMDKLSVVDLIILNGWLSIVLSSFNVLWFN